MQRALVIGVNGQDGSYLAGHLLAQGWDVTGLGRQPASRYVADQKGFRYAELDLTRPRALAELLQDSRPDRIYHVAAIHGAAGFIYEDTWQDALAVNLGTVQVCLEYIRLTVPAARLLYASSLKAFGARPPAVINEETPRLSTCLYSITKNAATDLIGYYRKQHGARATVLYLFNHESPRRPGHFVLPRMVQLLAQSIGGASPAGSLRSLDFMCDWGSSAEYMELGSRLLEDERNQDYVMATGRTWTGEEFITALFERAGLDWRRHVTLEQSPSDTAVTSYKAEMARMAGVLGHGPRQSAIDVAAWILRENHGLEI